MPRFRKRPVVIEAEQVTATQEIVTLEGTMCAEPGDWIITGVKGERYPCKDDIFRATYERVGDDDPRTIMDLDFTVRTRNSLIVGGIRTLTALVKCSQADLRCLRNFGKRSMTEVQAKLVELGYELLPISEADLAKERRKLWQQRALEAEAECKRLRAENERLRGKAFEWQPQVYRRP
jgi:hypothetical protein